MQINVPEKASLAVILVCSILSVFFMNTGILSVLYLAPLGYAVMATGCSWFTFFSAAIINIIYLFINLRINNGVSDGIGMEILYITTLFFMFIWIIGGRNLRTMYRFILASIAGAVVFLFFISRLESGFYELLNEMIETLYSSIISSRRNLAEAVTAETLLEAVKTILIRGGALVSIFFLFYINRQIAVSAVLIIKKRSDEKRLTSFFAPTSVIWVLSGALAGVLISRLFKMQIPEILAWNALTVCVIIFLAQGAGILYFMLSRLSYSFRLVINALIIVSIFSPLNVIVIAALTLLGITEIWHPFRSRQLTTLP
ncbi:MAG: hypothetical protein LBH16_11515 [Treponema sp.]|jgi:hypothetical protein|nr:hypothetical protein [Treponema sp.]